MWKQHCFSFFKAISVTYNFRSVFNQQLFANRDVIMVALTYSCIMERSTVITTTTVYSVAPTNARTYSPSAKRHPKHASVSPKEAGTRALAMLHYTFRNS